VGEEYIWMGKKWEEEVPSQIMGQDVCLLRRGML
jgi:hypothetical protein